MKDSKDLEARLPVKFGEIPVRWHIDRSTTGQRDIIVLLQYPAPPLSKAAASACALASSRRRAHAPFTISSPPGITCGCQTSEAPREPSRRWTIAQKERRLLTIVGNGHRALTAERLGRSHEIMRERAHSRPKQGDAHCLTPSRFCYPGPLIKSRLRESVVLRLICESCKPQNWLP